MATLLLAASTRKEALEQARRLAEETPPDEGQGEDRGRMREVAG